jgi:3-hydroxyisobutyrate dehydrogenase
MALAVSMIGTSEALALGSKLGMDVKKLSDVLNVSTARCWSSDTYNPAPGVIEGVPSSHNYSGGFGSALMKKDLGLALAAADSITPIPDLKMGSLALETYSNLCVDGYDHKDFSVIYDVIMKKK